MSATNPITGYKKLELMRLLADGAHTYAQLAEMFDSAEGTIVQFKHRHRDKINEIILNMEDQFAGLWIAKKANRIAEYQEQAERFGDSEDPKTVARAQTALRSVAEELGALPNRTKVEIDAPKVRVELHGVNVEDV